MIRIEYIDASGNVHKDITPYVLQDDFPEFLERTVKGRGYFDYEVQPFTFRILKGKYAPAIGEKILIYKDSTLKINGYIDSVNDVDNPAPEYTVFPTWLQLKDVMVGDKIEKSNGETEYSFKTESLTIIEKLVGAVVRSLNGRSDIEIKVTDETFESIPIESQTFFGSIAFSEDKGGIWATIKKFYWGDNGFKPFYYNSTTGKYYFIDKDTEFFMRHFIGKGDMLNWTLQLPTKTKDYKVTKIEKGSWLNIKLVVPPDDIKFPAFGQRWHIYELESGDVTHIRSNWGTDSELKKDLRKLGTPLTGSASKNISEATIKEFLVDNGYDEDGIIIKHVLDFDAYNTYVIAHAHKQTNDLSGHNVLISFEVPLDSRYSINYKNASANKILKDLSILLNRWYFIREDGTLIFIPRTASTGTVMVNPSYVLEKTVEHRTMDEITDLPSQLKLDDNGIITTHGVKLRDSEVKALEYYYKSFAGKTQKITTLRILKSIPVRLINNIILNGEDLGQVIGIKESLTTDVMEITIERIS